MDFIILKVNGEDVQNCSHEEAMEVFQRAPDPIIVVEVMRRPQQSNPTTSPTTATSKTTTVFPTPQVGGGGGLLQCAGSGISHIEMSSAHDSCNRRIEATRSIAVQTVLSAGEMAASLALAAASLAQQEARLALLSESAPYCTSGKLPVDYLYGLSGVRDSVEDEDCLEDEEENGGDVDDAAFGIDEVGCLNYILKRYPYNVSNPSSILPPFSNHPNAFGPAVDSVYANFPENPASSSSAFGNLPVGEYASNNSEKCFEVILQKQSSTDKFGLTLCYRPSDVQQDVTEVYISEIEPGSVAHRSGQIMLGDRLLKIGDQEITSREHVMDLFQECGLCAKITLTRQQSHWKQTSSRLPPPYLIPPYSDSTLDIGISNVAYAHLPDQDSGMGRTTDDSVRTEESSEQEVDEHKALLMNAWNLLDPTCGVSMISSGGGTNGVAVTTAAEGSTSQAFLSASTSSQNLDSELIHLSQLMQSLAMHCHKLAFEKMCGTRGGGAKEDASAISGGISDAPPVPTESGITETSSTDLTGDAGIISPAKARQTPRMGLGATSNPHKASSTNSISKFKGSSDASAISGSDFYEAVVMPKQSGNSLTLSLTQRQPHLLPQYDLDPSVPHVKGHVSMPPTNPSSIWSIAESDKEPESSQASSSRLKVATQFLNHNNQSSNIGSTGICERQENSTSLGEIPSCKPQIQSSNGGSLNGSKISCGSLSSTNSSIPISALSTTPNRSLGSYDAHANNPAYMMSPTCSSGTFFPPQAFFQPHTHPYEFYDRYFKNGFLHSPQLLNSMQPQLRLPPPPMPSASGMVSNFRYPLPARPQTWMCFGKPDPADDSRKDDTTSSNIYETPYAAVDIVNSPSKPSNGDNGDGGSVCFTSYGVINSPQAGNSGQSNSYAVLGDSQSRAQGSERPLMEWVVKKRTDGTRYITRRPVRSRQTKERSSRRYLEDRSGGAADDGKGDVGVDGGRQRSKGDHRRPLEQGTERAGSRHRRRGTPTRQSNSNQSQSSANGRGLVSLTTV